MNRVAIVYSDSLEKYDFGPGHPFRGDRFPRYMKLIEEEGIIDDLGIDIVEQGPATDGDLLLVHSPDYIDKVKMLSETGYMLTQDTPLSPGIVEGARFIVGGGLKAADLIAEGYRLVDSVGGGLHHAGPDYGGGFCVFNDVAICAKALLERLDYQRVLILDSDVHSGNGTMDIFYREPRVLFIDIHQDPTSIYPGRGFIEEIGAAEGRGYTVNVPLPPYSGNTEMDLVLKEVFKPLVEQFRPQVIIRNGGSDPHHSDRLGSLKLDYCGFYNIGSAVREAANIANAPVVNMSCSGYNPKTSVKGMYAILAGLLDTELGIKDEDEPRSFEPKVNEVKGIITDLSEKLRDFWVL